MLKLVNLTSTIMANRNVFTRILGSQRVQAPVFTSWLDLVDEDPTRLPGILGNPILYIHFWNLRQLSNPDRFRCLLLKQCSWSVSSPKWKSNSISDKPRYVVYIPPSFAAISLLFVKILKNQRFDLFDLVWFTVRRFSVLFPEPNKLLLTFDGVVHQKLL